MSTPLVEEFRDAAWRFAAGGAMVVAAAIIGGMFFGAVLNLFGKYVFGKQVPSPLRKVTRIGGGLGTGFLAGMFVFSGGGGLGWGGTGTSSIKSDATVQSATPVKTVVPLPAPPLRITLLGGSRVKDGAFYVVDGADRPRDFAEVQAMLRQLKSQQIAPNKIELHIYEDSVARNHAAVVELELWAASQGFAVSVETTTGMLPASPKAESS